MWRGFRLDRIQAYTTHRTGYLIPRPNAYTHGVRTVGPATVTVPHPADSPPQPAPRCSPTALAA